MIKKALCLAAITAFVMTTSCKKESDTKGPNTKGFAVMDFTEKEFDFGSIQQGDKVEHTFVFKNTGDTDLLITRAIGSCGCTVPDYPKNPIKPGEKSQIKVSFNSANKHGKNRKSVTITANTIKKQEQIYIKADIEGGNTSGISAHSSKTQS
ncbi:DUF1573 domain-containing protein [Flavobacterium sp.]|uniref:DUF1573 domain-containing protein n=1 Tax=Flavobacterium sp. TaxID=239 RepID=UPI00260BE035|nr:DUF1573 domain-containing protein [Flavobacterium sp.]